MLSYRHGFHAGNHADCLKHTILMLVLEYLTQKDKPLFYLDTHAGGGCYALDSVWAQKNAEHDGGIGRLWRARDLGPELERFVGLQRQLNPDGVLRRYGGSPWIARQYLRTQDRAWFTELHPAEYQALGGIAEAAAPHIRVERRDGFEAVAALLPPRERRGLVLMDPPYEVKGDYTRVVEVMVAGYRRFATGTYLLWYPVVERRWVQRLERRLVEHGLRDILLAELTVDVDQTSGMAASGVIMINAPWSLDAQLEGLLPELVACLGREGRGAYRLQRLAEE